MIHALCMSWLVFVSFFSQRAQQSNIWEPFEYFVGSWEGRETGRVGEGTGERTYKSIFAKRYLFWENKSTFPPQEKNPKGKVHEDWTLISYDRNRKSFVARQFNSEGYVNTYILEAAAGEPNKFVFTSEASENAPPGLRTRIVCEIKNSDEFVETFELAVPGKEFVLYTTTLWKRK